jgi:hypothetical protein
MPCNSIVAASILDYFIRDTGLIALLGFDNIEGNAMETV